MSGFAFIPLTVSHWVGDWVGSTGFGGAVAGIGAIAAASFAFRAANRNTRAQREWQMKFAHDQETSRRTDRWWSNVQWATDHSASENVTKAAIGTASLRALLDDEERAEQLGLASVRRAMRAALDQHEAMVPAPELVTEPTAAVADQS